MSQDNSATARTLVELLGQQADRHRDKVAFVFAPDGATEEDRLTYAELDRRARYDELTGLLNRSEAFRRIALATTHTPRQGAHTAVLFCDVDHFKNINDTLGHAAGDVVLSTLATRISESVRDGDTVGRMGGDEIVVLLPGVHSADEAARIAEKIRCRAAEPILHDGQTIRATLSIGATVSVPGESATAVTARADEAMYRAKQARRNTVVRI